MLEEMISKKKLTAEDMKVIQLDTFDIQARDSLEHMMSGINKGKESALKVLYPDET